MRLLHKFLCRFPAWVSGTAVVIVGLAIAGAEVWPVAKRFCERFYASALAIVTTQVFLWIAVPVVIAWLFAMWWTGPLRVVKRTVVADVEPLSEFISLDDGASWLYEKAPQGLKGVLKDHRPFPSITANARAHIGAATEAGIGDIFARLEPGFPPEPVKYKDLYLPWNSGNDFALRGSISDPKVRRSDLPKFLEYYANSVPGPTIEARRDRPLVEAVAYWCTREWGLKPSDVVLGGRGNIYDALSALKQGHQDGDIRLWAKPLFGDTWVLIDPALWSSHDFKDSISGNDTEIIETASKYISHKEPWISRAEVEQLREDTRSVEIQKAEGAVLKPVAATEELHAERRMLISRCRDLVHAFMNGGSKESFRRYLEATREYPSIRGALGKGYLSKLNAQRVFFVPQDGARYPVLVSGFLDELDRLEREWKIV